jgi:hypothetical protein
MGVTLHPVEVRAASQLEAAFAAMTRERPDALIVFENLAKGGRGRPDLTPHPGM